jgi:Fe2+ transport system protein FeoA
LLKSDINSDVPSDAPTTPLHELPLGVPARVRDVACERLVRRRLLELGLLPGTQIEVVRRAPLGDPIELRLRGYRLSIRADEARAIHVERIAHPDVVALAAQHAEQA